MTSIDYQEVNWEDAPSTNTPLSAENLGNMDVGLASLYRDVADLEQQVANINRGDGTNLTVTFGEPGEEGVDDAPLQPSPSSLGNIITGIHSRIRDLSNKLEVVDVSNEIVLTPGLNCGSVSLMSAKRWGNILFMVFSPKPSENLATSANLEVEFTGFTPAIDHDNHIGTGILASYTFECWMWNGNLRCRLMGSSAWASSSTPGISVTILLADE